MPNYFHELCVHYLIRFDVIYPNELIRILNKEFGFFAKYVYCNSTYYEIDIYGRPALTADQIEKLNAFMAKYIYPKSNCEN